ncbi:hypothetical protein AB0758_18665 [Tolypothrix bouteillei VB521301_2]
MANTAFDRPCQEGSVLRYDKVAMFLPRRLGLANPIKSFVVLQNSTYHSDINSPQTES